MSEQEKTSGAFGFMERYIMGPMTKLSQTTFVRAIQATGVTTIPFTIVGSLFLVFNILPMAIPALSGFYDASIAKFTDLYMTANTATMGILAVYFSIALGYHYTHLLANDKKIDMDPIYGALLSFMAFVITVPQIIWSEGHMSLVNELSESKKIIDGWQMGGGAVYRFGTVGIFVAIIMAVLAVHIYKFCIARNIVIKMPDAVPQGVANSFTALIPTAFIAFAVLIINCIFVLLGTDIFQVIQIPFGFVTNIAGTYGGLLVIVFLMQALWSVGVHGATIITSLVQPIMLANMAENVQGANHPLAGEFWNAFGWPGGSGSTLLLVIFMAFLAKSEQLKVLGRSAIAPAIFNINEPIIFGVPMIYNPDMLLPFILAPMASSTVGYLAIKWGFCHPIVALQPWPTPGGVGAFIATGGDWRAIIVSLVCIAVAGLVYYPFFLRYDRKLKQKELDKAAEGLEDEDDDDFFSLD